MKPIWQRCEPLEGSGFPASSRDFLHHLFARRAAAHDMGASGCFQWFFNFILTHEAGG